MEMNKKTIIGITLAIVLGVVILGVIFLQKPAEEPEGRVILNTTKQLIRPDEEEFEHSEYLKQGETVRIRFRVVEGNTINFRICTSPPEMDEYKELIAKNEIYDPQDFEWSAPKDGTYRFRFCLGGGSDSANFETKIAIINPKP